MERKSRFDGTERPVDIPIMIDKLCGKSDRSKHTLYVMALNMPFTIMFSILLWVDAN